MNLQLDPAWSPPPRVWGRFIVWVDDVDAVHRRLIDHGVEPEFAPSDAPWGERYFHVLDPAGHEVSIARRLDPSTERRSDGFGPRTVTDMGRRSLVVMVEPHRSLPHGGPFDLEDRPDRARTAAQRSG